MKLNFEDDPGSESIENIKFSQTDSFYNKQIKIDEIYQLKVSIKFIKILSIISIIFCIIFTIVQFFQDYQFTSFQMQLNRLKMEIEEIKSNNIYNKEKNETEKLNKNNINNNNDDNIDNIEKMNHFIAENNFLKEKFNKEISFLQQCMIATKLKIFEKIENPKIAIVVPTYKTERYINRLVQSIQKQKIKEVEIIFVEDSSEKKEFPKLEEISKIDKRIRIFKNEKNKGLINSYIKGISKVKSKYMIFLEEEGMLLPNLKEMVDLIEIYNRDINDFSFLKGTLNGITYEAKINDGEKSQPEISESYYNENFINENPLLNKVYKTEMIKNAINNINEYYLSESYEFHVDTLLYICLCSYSNSYKAFSNIYSEYHILNEFSKSVENIEKMFHSTLYLGQYIYELKYEYEEIFNQRCMFVINLFNWPLNYNMKIKIDIEKANKVISMFLNNKDINEENKRKINLIIRKIKDRSINKKND